MSPTIRRWTPVILWSLVIYTTIPFVRSLQAWFSGRWDTGVISWLVAVTLVTAALAGAGFVRRRRHRFRPAALLWIGAVAAVLVLWTYDLRSRPEEAIHLLEYGVLAVLIHRALRPSTPDSLVFVVGALIGSLLGTLDEIIQWFTPGRFWDWRDFILNAGAGALVQLALWRVLPKHVSGTTARSVRLVLRLAAVQLLVLAACLANTPARVASYAPLLPCFKHLNPSKNPMAEYGHLHIAPGIGTFKSRLDLESIDVQDHERAFEVAAVIDGTKGRYHDFLATWPVDQDPFTYELRVHLFARDRNLGKARESSFSGSVARDQITVAWNENLLIETYFGNTLRAGSFAWKPILRDRIEAMYRPEQRFRSAVGGHLITFAGEGTIRALLLSMVSVLLLADVAVGRYHRVAQ
jgi:VanZ family protein